MPNMIKKKNQFSCNLKLSSFTCLTYKYGLAQFPYLGLNHRISDCLPSSFLVLRKKKNPPQEFVGVAEVLFDICSGRVSREGNGNPLQYSCLENPRDRGAWGAAVYGVAQRQTWLTRLSSRSRACFSHPFLCFDLESPSYASPGYLSLLSTAISTHGLVKSTERWDAGWPGL